MFKCHWQFSFSKKSPWKKKEILTSFQSPAMNNRNVSVWYPSSSSRKKKSSWQRPCLFYMSVGHQSSDINNWWCTSLDSTGGSVAKKQGMLFWIRHKGCSTREDKGEWGWILVGPGGFRKPVLRLMQNQSHSTKLSAVLLNKKWLKIWLLLETHLSFYRTHTHTPKNPQPNIYTVLNKACIRYDII